MKIFVGSVNPCASSFEPRTVPSVVHESDCHWLYREKAPVADAENDERIKSAADDRQDECCQDCAANFRKEFFHS